MALRRRHNFLQGNVSYQEYQYDAKSGQCFAETTMRERPLRKLHAAERERYRTANRPPSLEDVSIRVLLSYMEKVTLNEVHELTKLLACLPWSLGEKVWKRAQALDMSNALTVWQAFTAAYPGERHFTYRQVSVGSPSPEELPMYIDSITSNIGAWLTCLTITDKDDFVAFSRPDIINISKIRNLVALDICSNSTGANSLVDDSVIRSWSRRVDETHSFAMLQVLLVRWQPGVTVQSLKYLSVFPSLVIFGVRACFTDRSNIEDHAKDQGWAVRQPEHLEGIKDSVRRDLDRKSPWHETIHQLHKDTCALLSGPSSSIRLDLPLLNFRLGPVPVGRFFSTHGMPYGRSPYIFFRDLTKAPTSSTARTSSSTDKRQQLEVADGAQQSRTVKRLKKQIDLSGALNSLTGEEH